MFKTSYTRPIYSFLPTETLFIKVINNYHDSTNLIVLSHSTIPSTYPFTIKTTYTRANTSNSLHPNSRTILFTNTQSTSMTSFDQVTNNVLVPLFGIPSLLSSSLLPPFILFSSTIIFAISHFLTKTFPLSSAPLQQPSPSSFRFSHTPQLR